MQAKMQFLEDMKKRKIKRRNRTRKNIQFYQTLTFFFKFHFVDFCRNCFLGLSFSIQICFDILKNTFFIQFTTIFIYSSLLFKFLKVFHFLFFFTFFYFFDFLSYHLFLFCCRKKWIFIEFLGSPWPGL